MPRGRQPQGEQALSNAERQARYRARHEGDKPRPVVRYRRPVDRRTRPQRWNDAAAELIVVQAECAHGATRCQRGCATRRPARHCERSSNWISMPSPRSNRHADLDVIDGHERA